MSPFERHGIKVLSPSSINLYAAEPSLWVGKYLFKWKDDTGASMARGSAVETGLDHWLFLRDAKGAENMALAHFADRTGGQCDDEHEAEAKMIVPCLQQAIEATKDLPVPLGRQMRVETFVNGVEVPLIGYVDYVWPDFTLDLKTGKQVYSEIKPDHARQVALYAEVRKVPSKVLYCSPKKHGLLTLSGNEQPLHMADLARYANAIRHLLSKAVDSDDAAKFFAPRRDDFRWSEKTTNLANELWRAA